VFLGATPAPGTVRRLNPSGYPESRGAFADRARQEAEAHLARLCRLEFGTQTEFPEPPVRINSDLVNATALGWDEAWAWDNLWRITLHSSACFLITLVLSLVAGETRAQTVPTNAELQALPAARYLSVTSLGFFTPGDWGRANYVSSGSACSLNGGNGDEGSQVKPADGKCWLADLNVGPPSVKIFGAVADKVTNDVAPLQSYLAFSGARRVACRVSAGATLAVDEVTLPSDAP